MQEWKRLLIASTVGSMVCGFINQACFVPMEVKAAKESVVKEYQWTRWIEPQEKERLSFIDFYCVKNPTIPAPDASKKKMGVSCSREFALSRIQSLFNQSGVYSEILDAEVKHSRRK